MAAGGSSRDRLVPLLIGAGVGGIAWLGASRLIRVFGNRRLSGGEDQQPLSATCIGFDLDHALGRYRLRPCFELIYAAVRAYAAERHGVHLVETLDGGWCQKGLVLDTDTGDLIKLSAHGRVCAARHGTGPFLGPQELNRKYGSKWRRFDELRRSTKSPHYFVFITYFEVPAGHAIAQLVDHCDATSRAYSWAVSVVCDAFNYNFNPEAFPTADRDSVGEERGDGGGVVGGGRGLYFPTVKADPERYIWPRPKLAAWLAAKRAEGRTLFLVTNSRADYADCVLRCGLGPGWRALFDLVVTSAGKPVFFSDTRRPFRRVGVDSDEVVYDVSANDATLYAEGNWAGVERAMRAKHVQRVSWLRRLWLWLVRGRGFSVTYVGDHLISDVAATRQWTAWQAVAVVEEGGGGGLPPARGDDLDVGEGANGLLGAKRCDPDGFDMRPAGWGSFFVAAEGCYETSFFASLIDQNADQVIHDCESEPLILSS